jgi:hypothetical protein
LAFRDPLGTGGCTNQDYYSKIIQIINGANWYDSIQGLSILGGDFALGTTLGTRQLSVRAIPLSGAAFTPPAADLSWDSSVPGKATVGLHNGLVTGVASGTTNVHVTITAAPTLDATVVVTVP